MFLKNTKSENMKFEEQKSEQIFIKKHIFILNFFPIITASNNFLWIFQFSWWTDGKNRCICIISNYVTLHEFPNESIFNSISTIFITHSKSDYWIFLLIPGNKTLRIIKTYYNFIYKEDWISNLLLFSWKHDPAHGELFDLIGVVCVVACVVSTKIYSDQFYIQGGVEGGHAWCFDMCTFSGSGLWVWCHSIFYDVLCDLRNSEIGSVLEVDFW